MRFSSLTLDFKNLFMLDVLDNELLKKELLNFCYFKIDTLLFESKNRKLFFDFFEYSKNFYFDSNNNIIGINNDFLINNKDELFSFLSKNNFQYSSFGEKEFYFYTFDIFSILYYLFKITKLSKKVYIDSNVENIFTNFKVNKKRLSKTSYLNEFKNVLYIFDKYPDLFLNKFKYLAELTDCNFLANERNYYLNLRNTKEVNSLIKENKSIHLYFSKLEPNFDLFISFLRESNIEESDIQVILILMNKLYKN